ncbi:MAG: flagellar hook-associated protein FlgK, partial [Desulfovibrio sp.]|nr:flagellar hook-associated protein FlgK [Desulfovibrio sp.]
MISNLLTIGKSALNTAQAWVNVTGDNIANADTPGYTRRYVAQNEAATVTIGHNQYGLGSNAEQILRYFDKFLEDSYLHESTISSRWTEYDSIMETLESVFNEANTTGLSDTLDKFFNAWQKLALNPDDPSVRTSILTYGQTLGDMFKSVESSVVKVQ